MHNPTFIAIVDFAVSAADRPLAVDHLERERPSVRAMPGCVEFRVFPSPGTDTEITVLHEWRDQAAFTGYLESEEFARSGEVLRPLMTRPPSSRRFQVRLVETAV